MSSLNPTWVIVLRDAWSAPWTACHGVVRQLAGRLLRRPGPELRVSERWLSEHEAAAGKQHPD